MTLIKRTSIFIILSSTLLSCSEEKLSEHLTQDLSNKSSIVILSEKGCSVCNEKLANAITSQKYDSTLILVSALGVNIDISGIQENKYANDIVFKHNLDLSSLGIEQSGVILLSKEKNIDSIININALEIEEQIQLVKSLYNTSENQKTKTGNSEKKQNSKHIQQD